jgi:hypothetical protein
LNCLSESSFGISISFYFLFSSYCFSIINFFYFSSWLLKKSWFSLSISSFNIWYSGDYSSYIITLIPVLNIWRIYLADNLVENWRALIILVDRLLFERSCRFLSASSLSFPEFLNNSDVFIANCFRVSSSYFILSESIFCYFYYKTFRSSYIFCNSFCVSVIWFNASFCFYSTYFGSICNSSTF